VVRDAHLSRAEAERIRDGLRQNDLCDERLWDEFLRAMPDPEATTAKDANLPADAAERGRPPADWLRPGEGLAATPLPTVRVLTGIATLDEKTRGGLPAGIAVVLLGGPDAGKTGFAMTVADAAEAKGFVVVHIAADGGREAAEVRWGQAMGFDRAQLEERKLEIVEQFRQAFAKRNIFLPDPDQLDDEMKMVNTLDRVITTTATTWPGSKVLLLVDSLQAVRPDDEQHDGPRLRVNAVLGQVRRAANFRWLVVATSHTNRSSRRFKREGENADPMTAGMESGAIEHVFELMVELKSDADDPEGVQASIVKNKPGSGAKGRFGLIWDKDRARFAESEADLEEQKHRISRAKICRIADQMGSLLAEHQ
jgi:KaiC/GvpD/RAD55 family RecA-like ATPase